MLKLDDERQCYRCQSASKIARRNTEQRRALRGLSDFCFGSFASFRKCGEHFRFAPTSAGLQWKERPAREWADKLMFRRLN